jgi:MscS family membrane protein
MIAPHKYARPLRRAAVLLLVLLCPAVWPQVANSRATTTQPPPELPKDTLGRDTPRGTVLGLLSAARKGNAEIAALYLNTSLRGADAAALARQLAAVLDRRLPARLNEISDKPEGSRPNPLKPDEDLVGIIETATGDLDILVERVDRGKAGKVWLFSRQTLASIPDVYQELSPPVFERILPQFMITTRVAQIPIFQWLALFVGMPLLYFLAGVLNRIIGLVAGALRRHVHGNPELRNPQVLPRPIRLLLVAFAIRWVAVRAHFPLLARQFWSTTALIITIVACVWLLMLLNGWTERHFLGRRRISSGSASVLRLVRRLIDGIVLFGGLLLTLSYFGVNVTAALAGLGVGGIAVALAAQKTLENIIAGVSLIADQAVRVGDTLNVGDVQGTVEEVGLRSTRVRTLDRTLVSLPNGQIASMKVETVSARDRFLFHPVVALCCETTPLQLRTVMDNIRQLLSEHTNIDSPSVRVRFVRLGACSLDVDIFAYAFARDWNNFLEIQEDLLFCIMEIIDKEGTRTAFPSQTLYLADTSEKLAQRISDHRKQRTATIY